MLNTISSLAKKLFCRNLSRAQSRGQAARPGVEMLEDRLVPSAAPWPAHFFAPYVNTMQDQQDARFNDYTTAAYSAGTKYLALGFITADSAGQPSWEGDGNELGSAFDIQMQNQVSRLRAHGGDVMISFGGASGTELAMAIQDPQQLQQAYQQVIDEYGLTHVDFDIEGSAATDTSGSIDVRSQAIAGLEQWAAAQGKDLKVYLTLPTSSVGLMADQGLNVLDSALRYGVKIAGVNIMTMDYADYVSYDGVNGPSMGDAAISAAQGLFAQLKTELATYGVGASDSQVWQMIGITPQIGTNVQYVDGEFRGTEVFGLSDAQKVESFASSVGVGRLSFWAIGCDQNPDGITNATDPSETYSGVVQQPFDYSHIFAQYAPPIPDLTGATFHFGQGGADGVLAIQWEDPASGTFVGMYAGVGAIGPVVVTGSITPTSVGGSGAVISNINFSGIDVVPFMGVQTVSFGGTLFGAGNASPTGLQDNIVGIVSGFGSSMLVGQDF
jgi:chitinase